MRAILVEHAEAALGVAEHHQVLAEQAHPQRRAVGLGHLFGKARRDPVAAHDLPHRRRTLDAAQEVVLFRRHGALLGISLAHCGLLPPIARSILDI